MIFFGEASIITLILWKCVMCMRDLLRIKFGITDSSLIEEIIQVGKVEVFPKGSMIVESGKESVYMPILLEGVARGYLIDANGKDITDCFAYQKGDILSGCNEIGTVSQVNIEAITAVTCVMVPVKYIFELFDRYPKFLGVYNRLLTAALDRHWEIKMLLYRCEAMERYLWFQENYADIVDIVSNRHIASFLGMTPVTLSRLRRKIRETNL